MTWAAAQDLLMQLGYKQVLHRSWGIMTTIAISISATSVLTSISGKSAAWPP